MEISEVIEKMNELVETNLDCITSHPGFSPVGIHGFVPKLWDNIIAAIRTIATFFTRLNTELSSLTLSS